MYNMVYGFLIVVIRKSIKNFSTTAYVASSNYLVDHQIYYNLEHFKVAQVEFEQTFH